MKIRVEKDVFNDAVQWVSGTLPARPAIPVLAGVLLVAEEETVTLSSFDYEASSRIEFPAAVDEPGTVLVSGDMLKKIASSLPNKAVDLELDGNKVRINCGAAKFQLSVMPVDEYPELPKVPEVSGKLDAREFAAAVAQVRIAAARDDTLPLLSTIKVEIAGDTITLLATDRYRLAMRTLEWQPNTNDFKTEALVKWKILSDMSKALQSGGDLEVSLDAEDASLLAMATQGQQVTSQLTDGDYPKVASLFPEQSEIHAVVDREALMAAVQRVKLVAERMTPIRLSFAAGGVSLEAGAGDDAQASESLPCYLSGDNIVTGFNPQYLLEGLNALNTAYVRFSFTRPERPSLITGQGEPEGDDSPEFRYLLMPIRVGV